MDYNKILAHLQSSEHQVLPGEYQGIDCITVNALIAGKNIELIHLCIEKQLSGLPHFFLINAEQYGELAHVLWCGDNHLWYVCVNDNDAVSINFEKPELVFAESLKRTTQMLNDLLSDEEFNKEELLREFTVNWSNLHSSISQKMICASQSGLPELLDIYHPLEKKKYGIKNHYLGLGKSAKQLNANHVLGRNAKQTKAGGTGVVIPLFKKLQTAPRTNDKLKSWYLKAIETLSSTTRYEIAKLLKGRKFFDYWIVFNGETPSGTTWFGLKLHNKNDKKQKLPTTENELQHWQLDKFDVEVLNRELLLPRSGANPALANKKVLLAGCGSVGSELAMKLGAAGIGQLDLCDPDVLTLSNTYRHALSKDDIGNYKVFALADKLMQHFPWLQTNCFPEYLAVLAAFNKAVWQDKLIKHFDEQLVQNILSGLPLTKKFTNYDLIIVAIGSPTEERKFHQYLQQTKCQTPVVNTWLEGYGVGGHAILDIPSKRGCFNCAYVVEQTGQPGLAANLNFLQQGQSIVRNHAGCGESFIPYGAVTSTQTALLAADLAISYLEGKINQSSKISYKGDAFDAIKADIKLATRYELFNESLIKTPLYHPQCHNCRGNAAASYKGSGITIHLTENVIEQFDSFKQLDKTCNQAAGLLLASADTLENTYWINGITNPKPTDARTPDACDIDRRQHNIEVERIFQQTSGQRSYFGTWYTSQQNNPSPSKYDKLNWQKLSKALPGKPLVFIIVGIKQLKIYSYYTGKLTKLRRIT